MRNRTVRRPRGGRAVCLLAGALALLADAAAPAPAPAPVQRPAAAADQAAPPAAPALTWHDLATGRAEAATLDRPLLVHFTADWCKWCKVMQRDTYGHPEVDELLRRSFVTARVDADRQPRLKAEFGVQGLPTIWFLSAAGEPITYIPGYVEAPAFLQVLRWIDSGAYRERSFEDFARTGAP